MRGVLLAGPDAGASAGVAFALTTLARDYVHLPALSSGEADGAERATDRHLDELRAWAQVVVEYRRGGVRFVVDHERLRRAREAGRVPVVTTDEPRVLDALLAESPGWLPVLVCPAPSPRPWSSLVDRFAVTARLDRVPTMSVASLVDHAVRTRDEPAAP